MKKIQISTIEKMADVQVIELDASFIAKAVKAQITLERQLASSITLVGEDQRSYDYLKMSGSEVEILDKEVLEFLNELCAAFLQ